MCKKFKFLLVCTFVLAFTSYVSAGTFTTIEWVDDSSLPLDESMTYTHAIDFQPLSGNQADPVTAVINGVTFSQYDVDGWGAPRGPYSGTDLTTGNAWSQTSSRQNNGTANIPADGENSAILKQGIYYEDIDGHQNIVLEGLQPGQNYKFTWYGAMWRSGDRIGTFDGLDDGEGGDTIEVNCNADNTAFILQYDYVATDTTFTMQITSADNGNSIHSYAWTNEVSGPRIKATGPVPSNKAEDVLVDTDFSWIPNIYDGTHNLFIGSDFDEVNDSEVGSLLGATVLEEALDVNTFEPGRFAYGTTYYWRVDEVNTSPAGINKGNTWYFTTEPYSLQVAAANITAEASSSFEGNDPNNTINESGLDVNDMHSNDALTMWISDSFTVEDVTITYDFDKLYKLDKMLVWNYNAPGQVDAGFKEVTVEVSDDDGATWTAIAGVPEFAIAPDANGYEANTVVDLAGASASSVRLTANSNHGSFFGDFGLSEVRFMYIPVRARELSPEEGTTEVPVDQMLTWRNGRDADTSTVTVGADVYTAITENSLSPALDFGTLYYWSVTEVNDNETPSEWTSEEPNFTTVEYAAIDDFEDYNNAVLSDTDPEAVWNTWIDGLGDVTKGGSQVGENQEPTMADGQGGGQSAPLYYDNSSANISEMTRTFASALDLTAYNADTLRLYYNGQAGPAFVEDSGTIVMNGLGADLTEGTEEYHLAYKTLSGDGSITAHIESFTGGGTWNKAGVMIRDGLGDESPLPKLSFAFVEQPGTGTMYFRSRDVVDANNSLTTHRGNVRRPDDVWLRLTRSGNTLTAEYSDDGVTFNPWGVWRGDANDLAADTVSMSNDVLIGIFVSAQSADVISQGVFSNVTTTGDVSGDWTSAYIGYDEQPDGDNSLDDLYVRIADSGNSNATIKAPKLAVITIGWQELAIPYTELTALGIDMSSIKSITVGIGDNSFPQNGSGQVFIDTIEYGNPME